MHTAPTPAQGTPSAPPRSALEARRAYLAASYADTLRHYTDAQRAAISLLYESAQRMLDTGGGSTCAKLLLGLYNGTRFRFDLTDLRRLDNKYSPEADALWSGHWALKKRAEQSIEQLRNCGGLLHLRRARCGGCSDNYRLLGGAQ